MEAKSEIDTSWERRKQILEAAIEVDRQARQVIRETERMLSADGNVSGGNQRANQSVRLNTTRSGTTYNSLQSSSPEGANSNGGTTNTNITSSAYNMSRSLSTRYPPKQYRKFMSTPLDTRPRNLKK